MQKVSETQKRARTETVCPRSAPVMRPVRRSCKVTQILPGRPQGPLPHQGLQRRQQRLRANLIGLAMIAALVAAGLILGLTAGVAL